MRMLLLTDINIYYLITIYIYIYIYITLPRDKSSKLKGIWYMYLKIEICYLKTCVKTCVDVKVYKNTCNVI